MDNKYGYFDDTRREFVITRPNTPLPWLNYLGFREFFGICSHTGGGYTFWKDARMRRLTRYRYNSVPLDQDGRILYLREGDTVWCPTWKPSRAPLDAFESRHGLGYTRVRSEKNGIANQVTYFVPVADHAEIWSVELTNASDRVRELKLFSYVEFCFFEALVDMTNFQRTYSIGEVEVEGSAIYHKTEYRERRNHYTLFACSEAIAGFDTDRHTFVGTHEGLADARVPHALGNCTGSVAHGWNPVGAHQVNLTLQPGETKRLSFVLAYLTNQGREKFTAKGVLNKAAAHELLARYDTPAKIDAAFAYLQRTWADILSNSQAAALPHPTLERMVNTWLPYQCMATFNLSRSASGFETGIGRGMGFRDSNQDILGFVHMIPARARERILDIAATQLADGTCFHQYQPLTKKGNSEIGGGFNDDPLWLILSTCAYIRETGDTSILNERCGYADVPGSSATLQEHLELCIAYTLRERGPHQLPLIGHADWNDCLNLNCFSEEPNESFQTVGDIQGSIAESLMIAGLFLYAANDLADLYTYLGKPEDARRLYACHAEMLAAVETHGWDGEWYLRAFDAAGKPVGTKDNPEGQIYIESQGWLILGGAGRDNGRAAQALASVEKRLYRPDLGVALIDPAYSEYHKELGEVTSYPPGYKENGGVFSHNNTWIQIAWTLLGEGDKALSFWESICPAMRADYDLYRSEPYVYAQTVASQHAPKPGEAKNTWLTGTAAWSYVVAVQHILGIQPRCDGLRIDPVIPPSWEGYAFTRHFRGTEYRITVKNPHRSGRGVARLVVNGEVLPGNTIPHGRFTGTVAVEVELGC